MRGVSRHRPPRAPQGTMKTTNTEKQLSVKTPLLTTLPLVEPQHHSMYTAECLCGHWFETPVPEYQCPHCKRFLVIAWGENDNSKEGTHNAAR
jgi:hypothetical protein